MSAQDSNNKTDAQRILLDQQQMVRIQTAIKAAIKKGLYEAMIYETVTRPNIDALHTEGYTVTRRGGRMGENNHLIKWSTPRNPDSLTIYTTYYPGGHPDPHYPL